MWSLLAWILLERQLWGWRETQLQMNVTWAAAWMDSNIISLSLKMSSDLQTQKTKKVMNCHHVASVGIAYHNPTPLFWTLWSKLKHIYVCMYTYILIFMMLWESIIFLTYLYFAINFQPQQKRKYFRIYLIIAQGNSEFFFYVTHSFYFKDVFDKNSFIVLVSHESTQVPYELLMQKIQPFPWSDKGQFIPESGISNHGPVTNVRFPWFHIPTW